jgi:hypothetical protein
MLSGAVGWRPGAGGVESGDVVVSGAGMAWRVRVLLVRFDPTRIRLGLAYREDRLNRPGRWSVEDAPAEAVFAANAGQFDGRGPWGWLVQDGVELREPGQGPLAAAVVADAAGRLRVVERDSIAAVRARGEAAVAFQAYPMVLSGDGAVPEPLQRPGLGVSHTHRDARLGLCELWDGRWLLALTRFEGLGGVLETLPFGLTTPEMGALLGGLGCRRAVLLDGGLSGQLMAREADGTARRWAGLRRVPAGLLGIPRATQSLAAGG